MVLLNRTTPCVSMLSDKLPYCYYNFLSHMVFPPLYSERSYSRLLTRCKAATMDAIAFRRCAVRSYYLQRGGDWYLWLASIGRHGSGRIRTANTRGLVKIYLRCYFPTRIPYSDTSEQSQQLKILFSDTIKRDIFVLWPCRSMRKKCHYWYPASTRGILDSLGQATHDIRCSMLSFPPPLFLRISFVTVFLDVSIIIIIIIIIIIFFRAKIIPAH